MKKENLKQIRSLIRSVTGFEVRHEHLLDITIIRF